MGAKCEGLYCQFLFLGAFPFKNNEEIRSIWRHLGARLGDQKAKDCIVHFHVLSHKLNFLENPKIKREHKSFACWLIFLGPLERPKDKPPGEYTDFSGRPQGASTTDLSPPDVFEAFRPHTPRMKYLPGGPHLPQIN